MKENMPNNIYSKHTVGLPRRLGAMFYDAILLIAVLFFASLPVVLPFRITVEHTAYPYFVAYIYLVSFLFFGWFWTHGGQTLGLKTWTTKLVSDTQANVTWKQAFIRFLASLACWLSLGIGFIWCYTNNERLAWNDIMSKTRLRRVNGNTEKQ